jgi:putative ABC transport system substrate-binding protein
MLIARRDFIALLGAAIASAPRVAAGQSRQLPVIGFLHAATVESYAPNASGFAQGLEELGFAEARNIAIEYRFANGRRDQLEELAAGLVRRPVAAIVAGGASAAMAAMAATATIPIVMVSGSDPTRLGLGAAPSGPGNNMTGVTFTTAGLMTRRLGFLRELVPAATTIGYLAEDERAHAPGSPWSLAIAERRSEFRTAAAAMGWQPVVAEIGGDRDYEAAFATFAERHVRALIVASSPVFASDTDDIVTQTLRHEIPTLFERRADVMGAGLISYGADQMEAWRHGGNYLGRILKGERSADMPVMQSGKLELVINQAIANSLNIAIPASLLAMADEVIQ